MRVNRRPKTMTDFPAGDVMTESLGLTSTPAPRYIRPAEGIDPALWDSIIELRLRIPGQTAKQLHASLQEVFPALYGSLEFAEVRKACSKLAKKQVENGGRLELTPAPSAAVRPPKREIFLPIAGIGSNHSLVRGDRLGTAAERGDLQQVCNPG